jgi:glycosyltransferase involved in cell wall biosynthesis
MSAPRLALFLPTMDDGGAERVMLHLGACFAARGHEVDFVVGIPGGPLDSQIPSSVRLIDLGARRSVNALPALARYLARERPGALLSTLEHSNILSVWARGLSRSGVRIVLREASVVAPRAELRGLRARTLRALMRTFYRAASTVVAVSQGVAASLTEELGLPARQIRTIYNPVVTPGMHEKANAPLDDPWFAAGAPPVVLGVGRLAPEKDFPSLLRAFAEVRKARPARLAILGEGKERPALEALALQLGVQSDFRLLGYDHNPFRYMRRATVFALTSLSEGLPGALIQAMACGCRVISTDCPGGVREIVETSPLAKLAPVGDTPALARGIAALLDDAARGPARVSHSVERFSEQAAVDDYLRLLAGT